MNGTKPIPVSKRMVWEAYKKVKANKGVAGVDGVSLKMFEERLSDNLYKVWNRLSSGSYFPPPELKNTLRKTRETLASNFDKKDPEFGYLCHKFRL